MAKFLEIADADQIEAYINLQLTDDQVSKITSVARSYKPKVLELKGEPIKLWALIPEVMTKVDGILTPAQRPLARKLIPRPHQIEPLKQLYSEL